MSEICEHPFCTRSISKKCSNHCQLDLCEEHITEHKNLFRVQYEKSFNNLTKSLNELIHSIEQTKHNLQLKHQNDISLVNETYKNKLKEIEQNSSLIISTQNLIKKKVQLLNDVKSSQAILYQYDIEQIKLYRNKIQEYQHEKIIIKTDESDIEMSSLNSNSDNDDDDDYHHPVESNTKCSDIINFRGECPLTQLGVYGLHNKHNIRLCLPEKDKSERRLLAHFRGYHHLTFSLSYKLTKAVVSKLNPLTTCIFQSAEKITDKRFEVIGCPLNKMKLSDCRKRILQDSLKTHLLHVHHLTLETSNRIVETVKNQGDLTKLDFDEDEFK